MQHPHARLTPRGRYELVRLDALLATMTLSRHGVVLSGSLAAGAAPAIQAALAVSELAGSWRQLVALDSWAPGDSIASVTYDFGDGHAETLAGPDVALAVSHEYPAGRWSPSVTVVDAGGRSRIASAPATGVA